jgi:hypothetical protein
MHDRSAWVRGAAGETKIGKKNYKNLTEFSRPCVTCGKPFSIFVTPKIAAGISDSNSFGLKNCEEHRRSAVRDVGDIEALRSANNTMRLELDALYRTVGELRERLATYELQPAMERAASPLTFPWTQR